MLAGEAVKLSMVRWALVIQIWRLCALNSWRAIKLVARHSTRCTGSPALPVVQPAVHAQLLVYLSDYTPAVEWYFFRCCCDHMWSFASIYIRVRV